MTPSAVVAGERPPADGRFETVRDASRPLDELGSVEPGSVEPGSGDRDRPAADLDGAALDDIALTDTALEASDADEGDLEATIMRAAPLGVPGTDSGSVADDEDTHLAETVLRVTTGDVPRTGAAHGTPRVSVASAGVPPHAPGECAEDPESSGDADGQTLPTHRVARVRIGSTVLELTVPAIIGRRPTAPRVAHGAAPTLVPVASPKREISAAHLSLRQSGRVVVATDLHSRNGTRVSIPGAAPTLLYGGDSVVVSTGSVLDLGEDIRIEVLAARIGGDASANGSDS